VPQSLAIDAWQHVAVTQAGGQVTIYLNGVAVATSGPNDFANAHLKDVPTGNHWLGKSKYGDEPFHGSVDDFQMYGRALSAGEIMTLAGVAGGEAVKPYNLITKYEFEETTGDKFLDTSGNGNDAMIPAYTTPTYGLSQVAGVKGQAYLSDGDFGYVAMPEGLVDGLTDFTWSVWINRQGPHVDNDWQQILSFGLDGNANGTYYSLIAQEGGSHFVRLGLRTIAGQEDTPNALTTMPDNTWTHVAVTRSTSTNPATFMIYLNGESTVQATSDKWLPAHVVNNWLGRSAWDDTLLNAAYDELRIYNRALNDASIKALATP
jgi:hypothetical protein